VSIPEEAGSGAPPQVVVPAGPTAPRPVRDFLAPFILPAIVVGAHLALFTLARIGLYLAYRDDFGGLTRSEVVLSFVHGLRYDTAILSLLLGVPLLCLLLPFRWARGRIWQGVWGWTCFAFFVVLFFILVADTIYYGFVRRHVGHEITAAGDAFEAVAMSAVVQYALPLVLFLAAVGAAGWGWFRLLRRKTPAIPRAWVQFGILVVLGWLLYCGQRGGFGGKRLKPIQAFDLGSPAATSLALNGPFCAYHALDHTHSPKANWYPFPEAVKTAQDTLFSPGEATIDENYPLLRTRPGRPTSKPNVVLIMLESWDAAYTDVHRGHLGLEPLGFTPSFDALSREGLLFTRFYACGQRSMEGMAALLCGVPTLPDIPYLGRGMEQSRLTYLGRMARKEGYDTYFIQTSKRDAFRNDAVSAMAGFETYLGSEDIPPGPERYSRAAHNGTSWDHEMFAEAGRRLATAKRPYLAFLYTNTPHAPFVWPDDRWKKRAGGTTEDRYLNSLGYADWSLGQFFEKMKASGALANTIFILTADHVGAPSKYSKQEDPATFHHTPCLILAPDLKPGINPEIASQLDVIPTIIDMAGWSAPHACLGTSLFGNPVSGRGAFCVEGPLVLRIEEGGCVLRSLSGKDGQLVRKTYLPNADLDLIDRRLLSIAEVTYTLLRTNRIHLGD